MKLKLANNSLFKKTRMVKVTAIASLAAISCMSQIAAAEVSANIGVTSQYHFRGIQQTTSASTSAGVDYENQGLSIGTWAADVDDGLEVDVYGSYAFELESGLSLGVGATTYQYTGDFDSAYNEINLSAGYGQFSLAYSIGKWDGVVGDESATEANYTILTVGFEHNNFTGTVGIYGDEAEGEYFDLAYATEISGFDVGVGVLISGSDLDDDESLYFSFSKTFEL